MEDNTVFKKIGRRYVPIGQFLEREWLSDGLWLVRAQGSRITDANYLFNKAGIFKVGEVPNLHLPEMGAMQDYIDFAHKKLNEYKDKKTDDKGCWGWNQEEQVSCIIASVFEFNEKVKEAERSGNRVSSLVDCLF